MAFTALVSIWPTKEATYPVLTATLNAPGTDVTITGDLSPAIKSEVRAALVTLMAAGGNLSAKASIVLDALDDIVITDLDDGVIASTASKSVNNLSVTLTIAGSVTQQRNYVNVVMPQALAGIFDVATPSPGDILLSTGVTPGTYTNANITVRADGRIESAESGAAGGGGGGSLSPGSVTTTYLGTGAVTTAKIADSAVSTAKIADSAVTDAKIDSVAAAKVTGLSDVATSGDYTDLTNKPDLSGYLTASDITGKLDSSTAASTYATVTAVNNKADSSALSSYLTTATASSTYLASATASSTYATKSEIAVIQQGVFYKQAVATRVASVAAATSYLASNQSARVLVDSGTAVVANGIYVYNATTGYVRATDFDGDPAAEIGPGAMVFVQDTGLAYICNSSEAPTVVGGVITSATSWSIYSKAEVLTASNGVSRDGNQLSLDVSSNTFKAAVPYDIAMDYAGKPAVNEVALEVTIPRAILLGAPASHYVKTLASGERPSANNASVFKAYRNATEILSVSYQADGTAVVAEPGSTTRSFAAGDIFKVVCTTYDAGTKNPKITFLATLA